MPSLGLQRHLSIALLGLSILGLRPAPAMGQADISPGLRGGATFMTRGDGLSSLAIGEQRGVLIGVYGTLDFAGSAALRTELNYVQKAGQDVAHRSREAPRQGFLEVPILVKVQFPGWGAVAPTLFAGPAVGVPSKGEDREGEYSLVVGGGADVRVDEGKIEALTFDARYEVGLTERRRGIVAFDTVQRKIDNFPGVHNQGLIVTAGVTFQWEPIVEESPGRTRSKSPRGAPR